MILCKSLIDKSQLCISLFLLPQHQLQFPLTPPATTDCYHCKHPFSLSVSRRAVALLCGLVTESSHQRQDVLKILSITKSRWIFGGWQKPRRLAALRLPSGEKVNEGAAPKSCGAAEQRRSRTPRIEKPKIPFFLERCRDNFFLSNEGRCCWCYHRPPLLQSSHPPINQSIINPSVDDDADPLLHSAAATNRCRKEEEGNKRVGEGGDKAIKEKWKPLDGEETTGDR